MKKITSLFLLLGMAVMVTQPVVAQTLRDDIREDVVEEVETLEEDTQDAITDALDSTVETRKTLILEGLDGATTRIDNAQAQLAVSEYASEATVKDCNEALGTAETQLEDTIIPDVKAATDNESLSAARIAAVDWVADNKSVAKECAISLALDGIEATNKAVDDSVEYTEKVLLPYYKYYKLDTTTLEALVKETKDELDVAVPEFETAEDERSQASLEAASRASGEAVVASGRMYEEAAELYEELEAVE